MARGHVTARTGHKWHGTCPPSIAACSGSVVTMEGDVPRSETSRAPRRAAGPPLLFAALLLASEPLRAQTPGASLVAQRVDQPPKLEDFLAPEPPAGGVHVSDFRQREPGDGVPVSVPTTAYVSYDDANLYVVFVCRDDPAKIRAGLTKREEISVDDGVAVYLDTFRDRKRAYLFQTNPLGVQLDGILTEGQDDDYSFDAVWQSEGRLTADGYGVRIAIPFRSLRFAKTPLQSWGIALARYVRRSNEEAFWPLVTKRLAGFGPQLGLLQRLRGPCSGQLGSPGAGGDADDRPGARGVRGVGAAPPAAGRARRASSPARDRARVGGRTARDRSAPRGWRESSRLRRRAFGVE